MADRKLRTGTHTVADVFCVGCNDRLGWYYHKAADFSQKYKEGIESFDRSLHVAHDIQGNIFLNARSLLRIMHGSSMMMMTHKRVMDTPCIILN